jgi:hypothetical protein
MKSFPAVIPLALLIVSAHAQSPTAATNNAPATTPAPAPGLAKHVRLKYTPPKTTATGMRIDGDGGSRGGVKLPSLYVLAPNHTGLTTHAQPSLFWYQNEKAGTRFELTVIEPKKPAPLLRVGIDKVEQAGIHRFQLARHKITLKPGVLYRWTIALVPDAANRSQDVIASGAIERTEPDAPLAAALADSKGLDKAALYASKGYWYDALEVIADEMNASPKNREIRLQRAALLEQAGLKDAAASDR